MHHFVSRLLAASSIAALVALPPAPAMAALAIAADTDTQTIVVTGTRDSYKRKSTSTATKTDTPLQDVPQAISVVTGEQIADQGLRTIADVLRAVPGANSGSGEGHRDQILLRGQNSTADFFVDGLRDDVQYYRPLYNLDRVEVLKGPNAMIFGRGGGGGVVNRVTKQATPGSFAAGSLSLDNHGAISGAIDANLPMTGALSGRLNAVHESFDSFRDHVDGRRSAINPTLGLTLGESGRVDLSYEHVRDRRTVDRGIPSFEGRPLEGAQSRFFGDPHVNRTRLDADVVDARFDQRLGDSLRWTVRGRFGAYDKAYANALAATAVTASDTVGIEAYRSTSKRQSLLLQNDVVADFATGGLTHKLLAGVDYSRQDGFSDRQQGFFDTAGTIQRLFVPVGFSDDLPTITFRDSAARRATAADTLATSWGVYAQDQLKIGRHVEIVAGLRRDWFTLDYADRLSPARLSRKDALWSPRGGVVFKPSETLSLYASWSKSFLPQSGDQFASLSASTAALAPEKFVNREIGAKWTMRGVDLTIAAYRLERTNTRVTDPVSGDTVLTGAQRSKGIEASAAGKLGKLTLAAAGALQKAEISHTTAAAPAGREVASVPRFTASLWGRYEIDRRIGLGLGIFHQSKSFASISNAVAVPGFTRVDAAGYFELSKTVELQLNLENVLDENYIAASHTDNNLAPVAPRTLRATLRLGL